jgi:hypothetical protein
MRIARRASVLDRVAGDRTPAHVDAIMRPALARDGGADA